MRTHPLAAVVSTLVTAGLLIATADAQRGPATPPLIREGVTEKVSDHVHVIPDASVQMVPNVGIIVGSRATLVIDTGLGARNGQAIMREVAKVSRNTELYLATTHFHPEHDLGAQGFPAHTKMLRSRDQQSDVDELGAETLKRFSSMSAFNAELLQGAEYRKADVHFDAEHTLDLGGVRVRLIAMGANHTRGDTAFFVEPDRILFSGDVVMTALPGFGTPQARIATWLRSQDRFEQLRPTRIVPSHGPMGDAALMANYRRFLTTVQTRAAALKAEGKTADQTVQMLQEELQAQYDRNRMVGAIRAAYNEAP
jgi:glyoxylase-like metal-dependent hydrolase (beta-lactamase superfamily II)